MIVLYRGEVAKVVVTVTEKTSIADAQYLFLFTNDLTGMSVAFIAANVSAYPIRYDEFLIDVDAYFSAGKDGFYTYRIFQQSSIVNLEPEATAGLVEVGKMKLVSEKGAIKEYNHNSQYKAYGQ
ncbi:hypothetical protein KTO58_01265 [Chitinophaga pendula]|uniref:hypothetical protein n=1 Tax=Chitinophaga TaxID=79328 RepID=UPI000BB0CACD|nr:MULTISPECIES: hypothetical protein [Chitinophaga]ASZ14508.1 hypothetical protein CK934_27955 [Chitinophaga sp. MD30]UCJ07835.1 hypothetical protein KTO58_01265 [Chitinophaga pendula]